MDLMMVVDAGFPCPDHVEVIDIALSEGVPRILDVLAELKKYHSVEKIVMAQDFGHAQTIGAFRWWATDQQPPVEADRTPALQAAVEIAHADPRTRSPEQQRALELLVLKINTASRLQEEVGKIYSLEIGIGICTINFQLCLTK